jgi:hypothetical protein
MKLEHETQKARCSFESSPSGEMAHTTLWLLKVELEGELYISLPLRTAD